MVQAANFVGYLDSFVVGWIVVDYAANIILQQGESFTKLRFFGTSFLSWRRAVEMAYGQVLIAMLVSLYVNDWIFMQMLKAAYNLIPITLVVFAGFHLYVLAGLPYNVTWKRAVPSGILVLVALLIANNPSWGSWLYSLLQSIS